MLRTLATLTLSILATTAVLPVQDATASSSALPSADEVLQRSIAYHDPDGLWFESTWRLTLRETRPSGPDRHSTVVIDYPDNRFELEQRVTVEEIEYNLEQRVDSDGSCTFRVDGSTDISDAQREKLRLNCERLSLLRNYYTYLWGLPMKLRDPGTRIDPEVKAQGFEDVPVYSLRVTYDEAVGSDIWYFYFRRDDYALIGYRFYHDEAANDGEVIQLAHELDARSEAGLCLPKERAWFTHGEGRFLGTDILVDIERLNTAAGGGE